MNDTKTRLETCFRLVFPNLKVPVEQATPHNVAEWDSVAAITLLNVIEEEFGRPLDFETAAELDSFPKLLAYIESQAA